MKRQRAKITRLVLIATVTLALSTLPGREVRATHSCASDEWSCHCVSPGPPVSAANAGCVGKTDDDPRNDTEGISVCCGRCPSSDPSAPYPIRLGLVDITCPAASAAPAAGGAAAPPPTVYRLTNPLGAATIQELIGNLIKGALGIIGSIALAVFIYGGFLWLTSGGNPEKITKGKSTMVWGTIGLAVILFAYTLVRFVFQALGI